MVKIIEFSGPHCGQCKMIAPLVKKTLAEFPATDVCLQEVDATEGEGRELALKHHVLQVPTFLFLNEAGEVAYRHSGSITAGLIKRKIAEIQGAQ